MNDESTIYLIAAASPLSALNGLTYICTQQLGTNTPYIPNVP